MKKFVLVALFIVVAGISAKMLFADEALDPRDGYKIYNTHAGAFDAKWQSCEQDSDCVLVHEETICCDYMTEINAKYENEYNDYNAKNKKALKILKESEAYYYCKVCVPLEGRMEIFEEKPICKQNFCSKLQKEISIKVEYKLFEGEKELVVYSSDYYEFHKLEKFILLQGFGKRLVASVHSDFKLQKATADAIIKNIEKHGIRIEEFWMPISGPPGKINIIENKGLDIDDTKK